MAQAEQDFIRRFAEVWAEPTADKLTELLHPDVVLYQPHLKVIRGKDAARAEFERLFRWLPGLHGEVERSAASDGVVFVEWKMRCPIGNAEVTLRTIDRFLLQDGLAIERAAFFSQLPLLSYVAGHPATWPGYLRYRLARRR